MIQKPSRANTRHAFSTSGNNTPRRILNYVWINDKPDNIDMLRDDLCSVPLHYFDRAFKNARDYPDVDVNIWVDYAMLDGYSRLFVDSYTLMQEMPNVRLHNLRDIPTYVQTPMFDTSGQHPIWSRVDYARLLVLEHCLGNMPARDVFYADFDVQNVKLDQKNLKDCMNHYGCIIGRADIIENSFFGFRKGTKAEDFLVSTLLPETLEATRKGTENGYSAMKHNFTRWFYKTYPVNGFLTGRPEHRVCKPMGYILPPNPMHTEVGIYPPVSQGSFRLSI